MLPTIDLYCIASQICTNLIMEVVADWCTFFFEKTFRCWCWGRGWYGCPARESIFTWWYLHQGYWYWYIQIESSRFSVSARSWFTFFWPVTDHELWDLSTSPFGRIQHYIIVAQGHWAAPPDESLAVAENITESDWYISGCCVPPKKGTVYPPPGPLDMAWLIHWHWSALDRSRYQGTAGGASFPNLGSLSSLYPSNT